MWYCFVPSRTPFHRVCGFDLMISGQLVIVIRSINVELLLMLNLIKCWIKNKMRQCRWRWLINNNEKIFEWHKYYCIQIRLQWRILKGKQRRRQSNLNNGIKYSLTYFTFTVSFSSFHVFCILNMKYLNQKSFMSMLSLKMQRERNLV